MIIKRITEPVLAQNAYLIGCQKSGKAILIDPLRDIDIYVEAARENGLRIVAAADTHIHADYLTGLRQFAELGSVKLYVSDEGGDEWRYDWLVNSEYDHHLLKHNDRIDIGTLRLIALHTPGHTPEHVSYLLEDNESGVKLGLISGDFVFVGDVGRPDLLETAAGQEGTMRKSAAVLFDSLQSFKKLPESLMLWPGHGAGSACGKSLGAVPESSVGFELRNNESILASEDKSEFLDYILTGQPEPPAYFTRMKEVNRSGPSVLKSLPTPSAIRDTELVSLATQREKIIVDTRSWEEFRESHIPRSLFVPTSCAISILAGSYISSDKDICLIANERDLDYIIRQFVRVGIDKIDSFITPRQYEQYVDSGGEVSAVHEIEMAALPDYLDSPGNQLVDLRRSAELIETGRIAGAYNISHTQLRPRLGELQRDKNLLIYCRSGQRSKYAAAFLMSQGIEVTHLAGGIFEWMRLRQPLESVT